MRICSFKPEKDRMYLVSPYGLGDTMILCGMRKALEEKYHCRIVYMIKQSHVLVMDMYRIPQYIVCEFEREELLYMGRMCSIPQKGRVFVAHPDLHTDRSLFEEFLNLKISFIEMYRRMMQLSAEFPFAFPEFYPQPGEKLLKKLGGADLENIILIAPEMNAREQDTVKPEYFEERIEDLLSKNERIVLNVTGDSLRKYDRLKVSMTLEELVALSIRCKKVISSRSGFCDLIFRQAKERLEIVYQNHFFWKLYHLRTMFPKTEILAEEVIISFQ